MSNIIEFEQVGKVYENDYTAIENFTLEINEGEFVVFLGPSGSGKSTSLRMLAGLEEITSGEIKIRGKVVNNTPSKDRDIAMVFQNYALYPHMTVEENMSFGLRMRRMSKADTKEKVMEAAELLELESFLGVKPGNLSGGQQQRVALGRAIVRDTDIFLMDEPLSNLDARLRTSMREEIVNLHDNLSATTVYVTHDQVEAMTMADKIVIIDNGLIQQVGSPREIYRQPANMFVANFIGNPSMNLIELSNKNGVHYLDELPLKISRYDNDIVLGIRPEDFYVDDNSQVKLQINYIEDLGSDRYLYGKIMGQDVVIRQDPNEEEFAQGAIIGVEINRAKASYFDKKDGYRLEDLTWE